jgi:nucleoid-associated protein YgaU
VGRDTKVGLFVGLSFTVLFGVILSVRAGTQAEGHADFPLGASQGIRIVGPGPVRKADPTLGRQALEIPLGGPSVSEAMDREGTYRLPSTDDAARAMDAGRRTEDRSREGVAVARRRRRPELSPYDETPAPMPAPAPAEVKPTPEVAELPWPEPPVARAAPRPVAGRHYTIREKDSLTTLSRRFYGSARYWRRIFEANRDVIRDPDLLVVGKEIVIPDPPRGAQPAPPSEPTTPAPVPEPAQPQERERRPIISVTADQLAQVLGNHSDLVEARGAAPATYVVKPGESFHSIARKLYGDESLGRLLRLKNEHLVPDPLLLQAGQKILLLEGQAPAG